MARALSVVASACATPDLAAKLTLATVSFFLRELAARATPEADRRWFYRPYDQLHAGLGSLATLEPRRAGIVLVETPAKAARRPYHRQKLALVLTNQRHFALEQAARGVAVRYVFARGNYAEALEPVIAELGPLHMMDAAERELRLELAPLIERGALRVEPHTGWLTTRADFLNSAGAEPPWRMEKFYRALRQRTGFLMERGKPLGGKYSHDAANRKAWRGSPAAPEPPRFVVDAITLEVARLIESRFADHPGTLELERLPASAEDAERLWSWAKTDCLAHFGPYEDALSSRSSGLFHTRISSLLNLHRLLPARVVSEVASDAALPLASREGFLRQVLGWREFVRHVHRQSDGFRRLPPGASTAPTASTSAGARPSLLSAHQPLPAAFWGERSGLECVDRVIAGVWREGWSHHISRLMVLSNLATLLGIEPRELCDWFWAAYTDAYDWVVEPNVLAMGSFAVGDLMTTKPYVSGAAYIDKMSDFCQQCAFDPKLNCPFTRLYWAFLARQQQVLETNPRFAGPMQNLARRSAEQRELDAHVQQAVLSALARRELLTPESLLRRPVR